MLIFSVWKTIDNICKPIAQDIHFMLELSFNRVSKSERVTGGIVFKIKRMVYGPFDVDLVCVCWLGIRSENNNIKCVACEIHFYLFIYVDSPPVHNSFKPYISFQIENRKKVKFY